VARPTASIMTLRQFELRGARRAMAGLAFLVAFAGALPAQAPPLTPGARVRVVPIGEDGYWAVEGRLLRLRPDSVTIELTYPTGRIRGIALDGTWRVEVAGQSHRHVGRRVLWGVGIGAAAVGFLAYAGYEPCTSQQFLGCMLDPGPGGSAAFGAIFGAFLGGAVGLTVGLLTRDVQWLRVQTEGLSVGLAPLPAGGLGVRASFRR